MSGAGLNYIREKGFQFKTSGAEIILRECPFCQDTKFHFYIEPNEGQFFCHKCQEKGNLITLKKHLGDYEPQGMGGNGYGSTARKPQGAIKQAFPAKMGSSKGLDEKMATEPHERLLKDAEALRYLNEERKLTAETIKAFKLGLKVDPDGGRWLTIPHFQKGKLVNIKYRSLPPAEKTFRRVTGCPSILFNGDCIEQFPEEIYVCESEIDCITLLQTGFKNVVGVTCGAGTFDPSWIDQLAKVKKLCLCYDPDEAGQKGAREVARRLGYGRCFNVEIPNGQDVNDFFREHDIFEFQALVNEARQFDVSGVMSIEQGFEKFLSQKDKIQETGLLTPWPSVNRLIKTGFQPGELIVLSAPPKIGKSTLALQIASYNAFQDISSLFFCLEMRPMKVIEKIIQYQTQAEILGPDEIRKTREAFTGKPLYLGYCYQKPSLEGVIEIIKAAVQRYGLKLAVFDHLHFLVRSEKNQTQEIGLAVQAFKFLAEETEIPIILVAQPRKIQENAIMTAMDLKDSISIYSDCDHLIILHRRRKASKGKDIEEGMETLDFAYEPVTLVRLEASRYNAGGECLLYYHGEYSRFDELEKRR